MAPSCPECGSFDTRRLNPPTMKRTKDYTCEDCGHSWNSSLPRGPHSDQRSF